MNEFRDGHQNGKDIKRLASRQVDIIQNLIADIHELKEQLIKKDINIKGLSKTIDLIRAGKIQ